MSAILANDTQTLRKQLAGLRDVAAQRAQDADKIRLAEQSLHEFVLQGWHVVEPATPFIDGWHLEAICDHLQACYDGYIRNLLINVPPRVAKSLVCSVFLPAWVWAKRPEARFLFSSYSSAISIRDSIKCRRLIQSPWYQRNWGTKFKLTGDQNAKEKYENDKTGHRIATSVNGIGVGEGGSWLLCDDGNHTQEVESDIMRQSVNDWWDHTMSTRGNDPKTVVRVVIQQRLHEEDLSGHILSQGGYVHLNLPMRYEPDRKCQTIIGFSDPREQPGELLWPSRFGEPEVAELERRLGSYAAAGQLQQRPAPEGGGMLKAHWWRYWQPRGANLRPVQVKLPDGTIEHVPAIIIPDRFDLLLQSWDCAFKDKSGNDFVCGLVAGAQGANRFLLDLEVANLDLPGTLNAVRRMSARWPNALLKLVEDKANGPAVIQSLRHEIGGFVEVNPQGGKIARAASGAPMVESGNWFLPHPQIAPWVPGFITECSGFPNAAHDDQVDAWSQSSLRLMRFVSKPAPKSDSMASRIYSERSWMA